MQTIEELSPELFIWELYDSSGIMLDEREMAECAIGYCDAERLQVRPRRGLFALMCETPLMERFWFHIEPKMLESLRRRKEKIENKYE